VSRWIHASIVGACAVFAAGCTPDFDRLDFVSRTTPPNDVTLTFERVDMQTGVAVGVIVVPSANGEEMDDDILVEIRSKNTDVLGVDPALEDRSFVIYGVGPGTTDIVIEIDGSYRGTIPASVILQQE